MDLDGGLNAEPGPDEVEFRFTATNEGMEPLELQFSSGQTVDFVVFDDDEVWRWSDGMYFAQMVQTVSLEPGESIDHRAVWNDPSPGDYVVEASLLAVDAPLSARAEFTV